MRTLPRSAKSERTSTVSSNSVGSATGMTKDRARPLREKASGSTVKSLTRNWGVDCADPCFSRCSMAPASGQRTQRHAATIEVSARRDSQGPRPRAGSRRLEPKRTIKEHQHALSQRRTNLALGRRNPTACSGHSIGGLHQVHGRDSARDTSDAA